MKWEKPELVNLNNTDVAHGAVCSGGSSPNQGGGQCLTGSIASASCTTGTGASNWCTSGGIAKHL